MPDESTIESSTVSTDAVELVARTVPATYELIVDQTDVRSFKHVDCRGDETVVRAEMNDTHAMISFHRRYGREDQRGYRSVVLMRDNAASKFTLMFENFQSRPDMQTGASTVSDHAPVYRDKVIKVAPQPAPTPTLTTTLALSDTEWHVLHIGDHHVISSSRTRDDAVRVARALNSTVPSGHAAYVLPRHGKQYGYGPVYLGVAS